MSGRRSSIARLALILAAVTAPWAARPREAPSPETAFLERLEVNVVNVEVFVTDKRGRPIAGLGAGDFEVFEDGERVELTNFLAPPGLGAVSSPASAEPGDRLEEESGASGALPDGAAAPVLRPHHVVLFVDQLNIQPHNRRRVLDEVRGFVRADRAADGAPRGTLFTVASYSGRVRVHRSFTSDPALVDAALDELGIFAGPALARQSERLALMREGQQVLQSILLANAGPIPSTELQELAERQLTTLMRQVELHAQHLYTESRLAVRAIEGFVASLAALPGRKALVYVSDGVAMRPGEDLFYAMEQTFQGGTGRGGGPTLDSPAASDTLSFLTRSQRFSLSPLIADLAAVANTHQVSFYTIDARGGRSEGQDAAVEGRLRTLYSGGLKTVQDANLWEPLQAMADDTGGRMLTGADVRSFLEQTAADFDHFYSLGYSPPEPGDGRRHAIEVKVKRRGVRVRHRRSYVDRPREGRLADRTTAALLLGLDHNPHGIFIEPLAPTPGEKDGQFVVPVLVKIPLASVALLPRGEVHACSARLFISTLSPEGHAGRVRELPFIIEIPNTDLGRVDGRYYSARLDLVLSAGPQKVAVGFWDETGGEGSFLNRELAVGPAGS